MAKDGRFNFKLLVPPRVNNCSQVSAVKPQESVENRVDTFLGVCKSAVAPTKPITQGNSDCAPGQLCSKMFDEVEKIKCWKVKVDSDAAQSERKLQENKRTIETQRKAIQELQFQNESLSIKLEDQMSENEDWRNKHNATRNLCNLLKETFERSADKMQLFESERDETHHLLMENSERVQKLIVAFEHLRGQAEANDNEMHSGSFFNVSFFFASQQCEELTSSKMEKESLLEKLHSAEQRCKESEVISDACSYLMKKIGAHRKAGEYQKEVCKTYKLDHLLAFCTAQLLTRVFQIKKLKTQMAKELVKYNELENKVCLWSSCMTSLYDESNNQKRQLEEKHQKLVEELHDKSSFAADLDNKVLRLTAAEAIKSKEDAEHKCQHKTADIVALMEKHKNQYDRMVKEKDTELDEMRKRETEAITADNSEGVVLLISFSFIFFFFTSPTTSSIYILPISLLLIRTPPSADKPGSWRKRALELEPKSDSSDPNNTFKNTPAPHFSVSLSQCNRSKKVPSPTALKSPGTSLKLAGIKRMRDAGWIAVSDSEKKKKKAQGKIFA
uniref:Synaptonemal complex protein 1 n=1 Tax=Hippocampus comes TaxID=109280 RepID=A0A3Q2YV06_HIPCM